MIESTNKLRLSPFALPIASNLLSTPKNNRAIVATARKAVAPALGADHLSMRIAARSMSNGRADNRMLITFKPGPVVK